MAFRKLFLPLMIGQTISHYHILEKLGCGGMGIVYKAEDTRLGRMVALKFIPEELSKDRHAIERFRREAQAASALNHPNICTIYDIGEHEGRQFIVMELLEGQTLKQRIAARNMETGALLRLGLQVAEALEAAHAKGIVHRDIKPANLFVCDRYRLKVVDFGLAKLTWPPTDASVTQSVSEPETVKGTLPYMAPEQLRDQQVDGRADIYALGAVLYEMATGQRPFPEQTVPRLIDDIFHKSPPCPSRLNPDLPPSLEDVILKCLEKDPERRYQSARELHVDLNRLAASSSPEATGRRPSATRPARTAGKQIRSLVVLPLANVSRDPEQDYFADGMTEALITELAKIGALKVVSRTSAMHYKGADKPLLEIARELNVDGVVEGSVLRSEGRVRITAQLIHAPTDTSLWAESYQRELRDVLALQSDLARAIAREIQIRVKPQERKRLARTRPVVPEAYDAWLRARYHVTKWEPTEIRRGLEYFHLAIEKDPTYAPAYAKLAESYVLLAYWRYAPAREVYPKAREAALKALALDNTLADAHTALATVSWFYDWNLLDAHREFERALELGPNDSTAHSSYAIFLCVIYEDHEKALAEARRARELDPLSFSQNLVLGWLLLWARCYDHAVEQARRMLEMDRSLLQAHYILSLALAEVAKPEEAVAVAKSAAKISADAHTRAQLCWVLALSGERAEAEALLNELLALERERQEPAIFSQVYAALGDKEKTFECLERALQERDAPLFWIKVLPGLDPFRTDPRYGELLRQINFPVQP